MLRCLALVLLIAPLAARAADVAPLRPHHMHGATTSVVAASPYLRTWRTRKILKADGCWRGCEASAGHAFLACLHNGDMGGCVQHNDAADRACLWACRRYGGPLVDWAE
jgi:hypothetical protein